MTRFASLFLAASLFAGPVALAQPKGPSPSEIAVARRAFGEATELEKKKDWVKAEAKLREAIAIKETSGLRYHIGFCLEQQAKLVEALVEYDRAAEMLEHGAKAPDVAELIGPARERVRKRVARVNILIPRDVSDAQVEIDGAPVKPGALAQALPQNPGRHVIAVSAPDRQAYRQEVELDESESRDVAVDLPRLAATSAKSNANSSPAESPAPADRGAKRSGGVPARTVVLIAETVVTAASLGVGIYFLARRDPDNAKVDEAKSYIDDPKNNYPPGACATATYENDPNCSQLHDLEDQRTRDGKITLFGFVGAGLGAGATVATYLLWKPKRSPESALFVAPVLAPGTLGVGARGRF
jgi:hypothetical protein